VGNVLIKLFIATCVRLHAKQIVAQNRDDGSRHVGLTIAKKTLIIHNDELKIIGGEEANVKLVTMRSRRMLTTKFNDRPTELPALPTDEAASHHQTNIYLANSWGLITRKSYDYLTM